MDNITKELEKILIQVLFTQMSMFLQTFRFYAKLDDQRIFIWNMKLPDWHHFDTLL